MLGKGAGFENGQTDIHVDDIVGRSACQRRASGQHELGELILKNRWAKISRLIRSM